jgi:DNA-binding LytR/AlgR family response regulator
MASIPHITRLPKPYRRLGAMPLEVTAGRDEQIRLIIVEDDIDIYQLLKSFLRLRFPDILLVGHCETVEEVTNLVSSQAPDVLFLDIELKDGTAFEGLANVANKSFDIIVMTAQSQFHFAQEALRLGAADYLLKPFDTEKVFETLTRVVAKRKQQQRESQKPVSMSFANHSMDYEYLPVQAMQQPASPAMNTAPHPTLYPVTRSTAHSVAHSTAHSAIHPATPSTTSLHLSAPSERRVVLTTQDKTVHVIECKDIVRLEAAGKHTTVHLLNHAKLYLAQTLEKASELVPAETFYRVHRSHVINLECLQSAKNGFAFLTNGDRVDVSSRVWSQFLKEIRQLV